MPVFNRQKTLREQFFQSRALFGRNRVEEDQGPFQVARKDSFLASTPRSLKGSLLKNRLDNPLFRQFSLGSRNSSLKKVKSARNVRAFESDADEEDQESILSEELDADDEDDERIERDFSSRTPIIDLTRFKSKKLRKTKEKKERESRFGNFLFYNKKTTAKKSPLPSRIQEQRISSDSNSSQSSNYSAYDNESEQEVDTLTKLEDASPTSSLSSEGKDSKDDASESYVLYTDKGQAVRLQFFFDYLLITPMAGRMLIGYRSNKALRNTKPKIVYYEDLASWTNNNSCLRLIHIKNKNTAEQERTEIKLFINKKKVVVTPRELNEELKDRVSVLLAEKLNCDRSQARKKLERNATDAEVKRVVQKIDRSGKKCIAHSYTRDLISSGDYQVLNV